MFFFNYINFIQKLNVYFVSNNTKKHCLLNALKFYYSWFIINNNKTVFYLFFIFFQHGLSNLENFFTFIESLVYLEFKRFVISLIKTV